MAKPVLYSFFRSSASWRVRIALALKDIDYDYKPVYIFKDKGHDGQQNTDEYKVMNPMRQIPTLCIDGLTLTQSLPIMEYLEETREDGAKLLPRDPATRAQVRQISEIINSGVQPLHNLSVVERVRGMAGEDELNKWLLHWLSRGLQGLEDVLKGTSGKYCVGDDVTMADACLVPQHAYAQRCKMDMALYPTVHKIVGNLVQLEAFQKADQWCQPDSPGKFQT